MTDNRFNVSGHICHIFQNGEEGPVILWGIYQFNDYTLSQLQAELDAQLAGQSFLLAAYEVSDWDSEFSPWPLNLSDELSFSGHGTDTLHFLTDNLLPFIHQNYSAFAGPVLLAGYSLSGLFALWAFYESRVFNGCVCCSGSLWFNGWQHYAETAVAPAESVVYLSLGGKEPHSGPPEMAAIGEITQWQSKLLSSDSHIKATTFVWNSGGHFANSARRVVKGILWSLTRF